MEELEMINELRSFYKDKHVFLTGHTGFKGSWMLVLLKYLGARVTAYALDPTHSYDLYNAIDGNSLCESKIADVRNKVAVLGAIKESEPDIIFHFAAQALVRESYRVPVDTFETNVMGSVNVLESMRLLSKPCVAVMITTDKVYENMEWEFHYKENDRLGGFDPYSSSKGCAELVDEVNDSLGHLQHETHNKYFDVICCACGTGATFAGIVSRLQNDQTAIGFSALKGGDFLNTEVERFLPLKQKSKNWRIENRYHFGGYAKVNDELIQFIKDFKQEYNIMLDAVYTGKMFFGLFQMIRSGEFEPGTSIVAVHSGGLQGNKGFDL